MSFGVFLMPETKGKHFEDIADDFAKRTGDPEERGKGGEEEEIAEEMLDRDRDDDRVKQVESAAEYYRRRSSLAY